MDQKHTLSYVFNMSLGLTPAIIAIILCSFMSDRTAIYISSVFGIVYSFYIYTLRSRRIPNLILYITTGILLLLSLITLLPVSENLHKDFFPITLETCILLQLLLFYIFRNKIAGFFHDKWNAGKRRMSQSIESAVVSARVALVLGVVHFAVIILAIVFGSHPLKGDTFYIIFYIMPAFIFASCIVFNHIGIHFFNKVVRQNIILPVVNTKGNVIGKSVAAEAVEYKNTLINPVVRVAIISNGMLFLCSRSQTRILDKGKIDVPLERYLRYGESLESCACQLVESTFPRAKEALEPVFSIVYHFKNDITNRLNYLFILDVKDDIILCDPKFENGKLWTVTQIEQNLEKDFFGTCLEDEFEHLKMVIDTREKYKES